MFFFLIKWFTTLFTLDYNYCKQLLFSPTVSYFKSIKIMWVYCTLQKKTSIGKNRTTKNGLRFVTALLRIGWVNINSFSQNSRLVVLNENDQRPEMSAPTMTSTCELTELKEELGEILKFERVRKNPVTQNWPGQFFELQHVQFRFVFGLKYSAQI